jgi:hypothetical protein
MEENYNQENYITLSENEDFSDDITEITPVPLAKTEEKGQTSCKKIYCIIC